MPDENAQAPSAAPSPSTDAGAPAGEAQAQQAATPEPTPAPPVRTYTEEQFRAMQSRADKAQADADRVLAEAERTQREANDRARNTELAGITDPTARDAVLKKWALDDRELAMARRERELEADARGVAIAKMVVDFGVKAEDLDGIEDVAELRARAAELKIEKMEREMAELKGEKPAATTPEGEPAKRTPAAMRAQPDASSSASGTQFDASGFKGTGKVSDYLKAKRQAGAEELTELPGPRR